MRKVDCLRCRHVVNASDGSDRSYCGIELMVTKYPPHPIIPGVNNIIEECPYYEPKMDKELREIFEELHEELHS